MKNLKKKIKILVLGSNPETYDLIKTINSEGYRSFIIGMEKISKTKKIAYKSFVGDGSNYNFVKNIIQKYNIDAVMCGTVDILLPNYEKICARFNFPRYTNSKSIKFLLSKIRFNILLKKYGFKIIPKYRLKLNDKIKLKKETFPVLIKPDDSGGAVGLRVCKNNKELSESLKFSLKHSKRKQIICQKYLSGQDVQAFYTIVNGKSYLSTLSNRTTYFNKNSKSIVCYGNNYKSKHVNLFINKYNLLFQKMFKYLNIKNGIFSVQGMIYQNSFYPYDPGFRLQGEGQHVILKNLFKIDYLKMLINLSLGKKFYNKNLSLINNVQLNNFYVCSLWVLLKKGTITKIKNLETILQNKNIFKIVQRLYLNDVVNNQMVGTEKQVFARFYIKSKSKNGLINLIDFIHKNLKIMDKNNNSLIIKYYRLS
ncbi:hypothetical protein N9J79_02790 [Candidatus Pelagibacter ubique]|nr:hypothetical protein [Candidatus Pelagibacter ubique]